MFNYNNNLGFILQKILKFKFYRCYSELEVMIKFVLNRVVDEFDLIGDFFKVYLIFFKYLEIFFILQFEYCQVIG